MSPESPQPNWQPAEGGYSLALVGGRGLVCRNAKGRVLASVPAKVKTTETAQRLLALRDWLVRHEQACAQTVETWMLRSLPVPRGVLERVWADPAWRRPLENALVVPEGSEEAGFLRGASPTRGVGLVDLDGETGWFDSPTVRIPHPILVDDLDDARELATELKLSQGIQQLFREVHEKKGADDDKRIDDYAGGHFEQLNHALGRCRTLGLRVQGGYAVTPVWEDGRLVEARYWIGAEYPEGETYTGDLIWVDARQRQLSRGEVGPVAFSEGMRMAAAIYAKRKVEEDKS